MQIRVRRGDGGKAAKIQSGSLPEHPEADAGGQRSRLLGSRRGGEDRQPSSGPDETSLRSIYLRFTCMQSKLTPCENVRRMYGGNILVSAGRVGLGTARKLVPCDEKSLLRFVYPFPGWHDYSRHGRVVAFVVFRWLKHAVRFRSVPKRNA